MAHILVVDDSPTQRHVFKSILEENGHRISIAENGEQAISIAKQSQPDVIFMDVVMPGVNGFQATRKLSQLPETANIPIIMVTTKSEQTDKVWATRQGARGYLVKPVNKDDLVASIQSVMAG